MLTMRLVQRTGTTAYKMDSMLFDICACLTVKCNHIVNIILKHTWFTIRQKKLYIITVLLCWKLTKQWYHISCIMYHIVRNSSILFYPMLFRNKGKKKHFILENYTFINEPSTNVMIKCLFDILNQKYLKRGTLFTRASLNISKS